MECWTAYVLRFVFDGVLNEKNINVCLFIFFQLKTIFINKNKSDNSVKNPAHPERSRPEFDAFSHSITPYIRIVLSIMCGC